MFYTKSLVGVKEAAAHIATTLSPALHSFYQMIHSINAQETHEDQITSDDLKQPDNLLVDYLMDLNAQEGIMTWNVPHWTFEDMIFDAVLHPFDEKNQVLVESGEGFIVLFNSLAGEERQFPIIVLKKSFFNALNCPMATSAVLTSLLSSRNSKEDYTAKISPALYLEGHTG